MLKFEPGRSVPRKSVPYTILAVSPREPPDPAPQCWQCEGPLPPTPIAIQARLGRYSITFVVCGDACRRQVESEAAGKGASCRIVPPSELRSLLVPPKFDAVLESKQVPLGYLSRLKARVAESDYGKQNS